MPSAPAQLEKKSPIDPNNDNNRHWLTYPNPKTPEYIIDIKKRLGQWKVPSTLARTSATSNPSENAEAAPTAADTRPSSASSQKTTKNEDQHNFLSFERRDTPDELRAARHRLDKHRYNPSLDSYPTRPKTCPVRPTTETTATAVTEEQEKQVNEVWTEENNPFEQDSTPSIVVQMVDCDGLPPEYAEALETANAAQEEYLKSLNMTSERRLDSAVYRLPAMTPDSVVRPRKKSEEKRKRFTKVSSIFYIFRLLIKHSKHQCQPITTSVHHDKDIERQQRLFPLALGFEMPQTKVDRSTLIFVSSEESPI